MRFRLIDAAKKDFPVQRLCKVLGVSASGYFAWKGRPACRRQREDMVLLAHVRSAFAASNETYGSPRMVHELRDDGLAVGRRRVARLMRENGMRARQKRRFRRTTDSFHSFPVAPNILGQDFAATGPNQKWGADISYVWTKEGWLYLAVVIDLFARRVVGWATSDRLHKELALSALRRAITMRIPPRGLIHHADRGSQGGFKRSSQRDILFYARHRSSASAGVAHSRVFRGRALRVAAMAASVSALWTLRSVPFGRYWRSSPLVFSLEPRCHGL
jgi:putative transposase